MESLGNIGALVGGLGVLVSAIFVGVQIRVANKLARADSQRHTRHAWQEALFYLSDNGKAVRKFLHNYEETGPDDQFKAAHALKEKISGLRGDTAEAKEIANNTYRKAGASKEELEQRMSVLLPTKSPDKKD